MTARPAPELPARICRRLAKRCDALSFAPPVHHVYDPLVYARRPCEAYLERFTKRGIEALFLGMNPGPFGMAQTGIPFGEVTIARDWLGVEEHVDRPPDEHPKRPILGFECARSEVSGSRLWGWARGRFGTPAAFFARFFVWNYCPLVFLEEGGRNRTPDKLPEGERAPLFAACDEALREMVMYTRPALVIGIGKFAEERARRALDGAGPPVAGILHPSPASPLANRGWAKQAEAQLAGLGVRVAPGTSRRAPSAG